MVSEINLTEYNDLKKKLADETNVSNKLLIMELQLLRNEMVNNKNMILAFKTKIETELELNKQSRKALLEKIEDEKEKNIIKKVTETRGRKKKVVTIDVVKSDEKDKIKNSA